MLSLYSANAVLSKARAMYGKKITEKNYNELLSCRSVTEIASYLKNRTTYSDVLESINENDVHRGQLEIFIKQKLFYDFASLGRYDLSVGEHFFEYLIARAQIQQIMHSLMLLVSNKPGENVCSLPKLFLHYTKINIDALENVKNYDDFLNVLKGSHYYDILYKFKESDNRKINLTAIETALYSYLYGILFNTINKHVSGKPGQELKDLFNSYIDLSNFVRIIRMKKFYNLDNDYIMSCLLPYGNLSNQTLYSFLNAKNNERLLEEMKNTSIGRKWMSKNIDNVDKIPKYMRFKWSKHNIRFSISPPIVLLSYTFLKEMEIANVINIIEGVRYKLSSEEIKKLLII